MFQGVPVFHERVRYLCTRNQNEIEVIAGVVKIDPMTFRVCDMEENNQTIRSAGREWGRKQHKEKPPTTSVDISS